MTQMQPLNEELSRNKSFIASRAEAVTLSEFKREILFVRSPPAPPNLKESIT